LTKITNNIDLEKEEEEMQNRIKIQDGTDLYVDGKQISPSGSQKVINHSPDGFSIGYGGSGPAQTALAILLLFTDSRTAQNLHQLFKWEFVAAWKEPDIEVGIDIKGWIQEKAKTL
jgi:hypothetical protein